MNHLSRSRIKRHQVTHISSKGVKGRNITCAGVRDKYNRVFETKSTDNGLNEIHILVIIVVLGGKILLFLSLIGRVQEIWSLNYNFHKYLNVPYCIINLEY